MSARRTLALFALIGAGALALAGCASSPATPSSSGSGAPVVGGELEEVDAGWLDGGRMVALVTQGSSTCVPTATDVTLQADGSVAVTLEDPAGNVACTRDYVPRASLVALPDGVNAGAELDLVVTYGEARGDTDLDAYSGAAVAEFSPSAGWIDDDQFAILTWGSSSCLPVVESVAADTASSATVVFAEPAADQVCTMDMAPRVTLAQVDGVDDDNATVTLTGGGAEFATPVTIPIAGD